MNQEERERLKQKVLSKYELYKLSGSRLKRILKDPLHTIPYFVMQSLGYVHPYKVTYTTLWGDQMSFYLPEGGMLYHYGFFEANLTNFLINFLREGDTFIDIGAHVGTYTILASKLVGEKGNVYSFEPTPLTFKTLEQNAKIRSNIHVYNKAILDKESTIDFFDYGPKFSAFNTFKKRNDESITFRDNVKKISVGTVSLDEFCKKEQILPTFIKIDAEGAEHLILQAMEQLLTTTLPVISIEVSNNPEFRTNSNDSIKILTSHGYKGYISTLEGTLREHIEGTEYAYENLIFVHTSKTATVSHLVA